MHENFVCIDEDVIGQRCWLLSAVLPIKRTARLMSRRLLLFVCFIWKKFPPSVGESLAPSFAIAADESADVAAGTAAVNGDDH